MQYLKLYKYFNYNKKTQNIIIQHCRSNLFIIFFINFKYKI